MPKYEYVCKSCGEHLEVVQSFKDDSLTECPACGGVLRKVFGNIGVVLKGSGFYRNDSRTGSRSGDKKPAADKGSGEKGSSDKGSSDKGSSGDKTSGGDKASSGDKGSSTGKPAAAKSAPADAKSA